LVPDWLTTNLKTGRAVDFSIRTIKIHSTHMPL
jgi:hypothetical protein